MLAIKNLENLIKIENDLKSQYEEKLSTQDAKIEKSIKQIDELLATIAKQKESLIELSSASADKKRIEQTNRELHNRSANLQAEIDGQKKTH